ncbi:hypothetical protein, variant [Phialophora macrospora]|uniref:BRCT domain-containing protein n=1 Tax=Phialophora macrospora TaxID=1851006 RepID=A0A0D2CU06_9EURO|nr:hypothetical protein, variant [Phialophora macrospora]
MATESLLNIDIGPLQGDLLGETKGRQPRSKNDLDRVNIAAATNQTSPPQADTLEAQLPSTVPDSQFQTDVESQWRYLPPAPASNKPDATRQKMTSQSSDDATQVLSQSHYDLIISRSRNERQLQEQEHGQALRQDSERDSDREDDAGVTQHEGDTGFVDLISSFETQKEVDDEGQGEEPEVAIDLRSERNHGHGAADSDIKEHEHGQEDSEPIEVDFSPTQSHAALSRSPEPQRFKTPVTAGKKRRYNGEVIDSPDLPRNTRPLLRGGEDNAIPMGLSQAFGATQANTSPFIGQLGNADLESDRPSPDIHLQPRPMTATPSSTMRPISSIKRPDRAGTEPLDHYISSKESQARREDARRRQLENMYTGDGSSGEDDLEIQEDSWFARDRRERERNWRIQAQLSSSPPPAPSTRGVSISKSSPIRPPARRSSPVRMRSSKPPRPDPHSSPTRHNPQSQVTESEEETEQEDNKDIAATDSSHSSAPVDEENKENFLDRAVQIPATTIQLHRLTHAPPSEVQESPLLGRGRRLDEGGISVALASSQAFAVADSQPERSTKPPQAVTQVPRSSTADDGLDFVPQSPETSPQPTAPISRDHLSPTLPSQATRSTSEQEDDAVINPVAPISNSQSRRLPNSTIPETSSNEPQDQGGNASVDTPQTGDVVSRLEFETAQTHVQPSSTVALHPAGIELSWPPTPTTPPGRRRLRLSDIQGNPSPQKSQSSFDADSHLRLEIHRSPTPLRTSAIAVNKTALPEIASEGAQAGVSARGETHYGASTFPENQNGAEPGEAQLQHSIREQFMQPALPLSTSPRKERRPAPKDSSARSSRIGNAAPQRRVSQFDLPESPEQKVGSASRPTVMLKRNIKDTGIALDGAFSANKQLKLTESIFAPQVSLPSIPPQQQDSPDPLASEGQVTTPDPPQLESDRDVADAVSDDPVASNMVFAIFNGKSRTYHPALCLGRSDINSGRFIIQWEGYDPDEVDEHGVRSLDLRIGDQVKIDMEGVPKVSHVIKGFKDKILQSNVDPDQVVTTDIRGHRTLLVAPKQRKSLPAEISTESVRKVPVSAIYLDTIMWAQMKDRTYECKSSPYQAITTGRSTPAPRTSSTSSSPSMPPPSRSRREIAVLVPPISSIFGSADGLFSNMAFAISHDDDKTKKRLEALVQENGGIILKGSFTDLFKAGSMQLKDQFADLGFTALLTGTHTRKVKYFQALGLGLPCLSGRWVEASVQAGRLADWSSYLLAAGECKELGEAVKSRVLQLPSSIQDVKARDTLDLRPKLLLNSRVVVVMGKGKTEDDRKPTLALIRMLGPSQVDTEAHLRGAKVVVQAAEDSNHPVDYVFVSDSDVLAARKLFSSQATEPNEEQKSHRKGRSKKGPALAAHSESESKQELHGIHARVQIMCNDDIVQSLILGRLWIGKS